MTNTYPESLIFLCRKQKDQEIVRDITPNNLSEDHVVTYGKASDLLKD